MELNETSCYGALKARDVRFDGRFFVGVLTTGIYCRPVCPARTPLRRNVRFYASAAAAAEAGFRSCLRCRPETAPDTPAWRGTSATVTRALRLLGEGALDRGSVDALAQRVGIGERHLRRLFREQLGASPVAVAQTRRLHFAKQLIDETRLPMTEIAFAAGYSSVRRFNAAVHGAYGRSPSELRAARQPASRRGHTARTPGAAASTGNETIALELAYRPPLAYRELLEFLAMRTIPGVEEVEGDVYRRTIEIEGMAGILEVGPAPGRSALTIHAPIALSRSLSSVVDRTRRIFDLDADPVEIGRQLERDPLLRGVLTAAPGLRVPGTWDGFELAVRAILGQQISVAGATTLAGRLARDFGRELPGGSGRGGPGLLFPTPDQLAEADVASVGMPASRAEAIRSLSAAICEGRLDLTPGQAPGASEEQLTALPGIGPWTARYIAMRALREPDAYPSGDLVLRRVAAAGGEPLRSAELEAVSQAWRPWRAYATVALWRSARISADRGAGSRPKGRAPRRRAGRGRGAGLRPREGPAQHDVSDHARQR